MNLGGRFVLGSLYMGSGQLIANAANLLMQLAIARLLGPAEFGIYAFCFAINEFLNIVGAFSLSFALIQTREATKSDYDTAFLICGGLGLVGLVLAALIAPILGAARSAEAAWILMAMAVARILRLLWQVPEAKLERSLRYAAVTAITTSVAIVPNVVAVGLAWMGWGAASLAARDVLVTVLLLGISWRWSGYRFRGYWSRESWTKLMMFARPMFWSRTIEILMERLDNLAVGVFFGTRAIGIYHQARFLSEAGFIATRPVERLSLNLYSRVQDDPYRLGRSWDLTNYFLLRIMLAGASVLLVFPEAVVRILLGDEWLDVAPLLRWLALYAGIFPVFHNVKNLLYGLGQVRAMVRVRVLQAAIFSAGVGFAAMTESLTSMAAALLLTTVSGLVLAWLRTRGLVVSPPTRKLVVPFAVLAAAVAGTAWADSAGWLSALPWYTLPVLPPLAFALGVLLLEGAEPARELRYLREQVQRGD